MTEPATPEVDDVVSSPSLLQLDFFFLPLPLLDLLGVVRLLVLREEERGETEQEPLLFSSSPFP